MRRYNIKYKSHKSHKSLLYIKSKTMQIKLGKFGMRSDSNIIEFYPMNNIYSFIVEYFTETYRR